MKRFFRRLILKHKLLTASRHLQHIAAERAMLDRVEHMTVRRANELQLALLNLEIRARRHA